MNSFDNFLEVLKSSPWVICKTTGLIRKLTLLSYHRGHMKVEFSLSGKQSYDEKGLFTEEEFYKLFKIESSLLNG